LTAALAIAGATLIGAAQAQSADNPYNLPNRISVATMSDAKPYVFTDENGEITGFDAELFRDVAARLGFSNDQVVFAGMDFAAIMPTIAADRFDVAAAAIGTTSSLWTRAVWSKLAGPRICSTARRARG
jgi:polar amino acid transport system substrate-binding protein